MPKYKVFYVKHSTFMKFKRTTRQPVLEEITHSYIKTVKMKNLNDLFLHFQVLPPEYNQPTVWNRKNAEADNYALNLKGVHHTSMSVGDCVLDIETNKLYECASVGWNEITD